MVRIHGAIGPLLNIKTEMRLHLLVLALLLSIPVVVGAEEHFETLQIGSVTYSNVAVMSKTPNDLFFTHTMGLTSVKVKDLDQDTRYDLGYEVDARARGRRRSTPEIKPIEMDPRVREMQDKLTKDIQDRFGTVARNVLLGVAAVLVLGYLFFCFCCLLICRKAGVPAPFIVWIPGLQVWALVRAAGMTRWTVSALFAPQIFSGMTPYLLPEDLSPGSPRMITFIALAAVSVIISIVTAIIWARKICIARNKNPWLALFLLFPLTSIFAFLYLAFSNGEEEEVGVPQLVTFNN